MINFRRINIIRSFILLTVIMLNACGGDASQFSEEDLDAVIIDPIVDAGDGGDEGGSDGAGTPTTGGSLTPEEFALLPTVDAGQLQFSDPGVSVTLYGTAQPNGEATITDTLWQQISGPNAIIVSPTRLNTKIIVPATDLETRILFQLVAQDSEGRVNASTTSVVVQPIETAGTISSGIAAETDVTTTFILKLSEPSDQPTEIRYNTFDGTAIAGIDYEEATGSVIIEAGATEDSVEVTLLSPGIESDNKAFFMRIVVPLATGGSTSSVGTVLIQSDEINELPLPELVDITSQQYVINETIEPINFTNSGGDQILRCLTQTNLPNGLSVSKSLDEESCVISGTPTELSAEQSYIVVATNPSGMGSATVDISVVTSLDLEIPSLASVDFQTFSVGVEIDPLLFVNSGGRLVTCESIPTLPAGLNLSPSFNVEENIDACILSGTPTVAVENTTYSIRAENAAGVGTLGTSFEILNVDPPVDPPELDTLPPQVFTVGELVERFDFDNAGGDIESCSSTPELPSGLSIESGVGSEGETYCRLSGTSLSVSAIQDYIISASNTGGTSTSTISITVEADQLEIPVLGSIDFQSLTLGVEITPLLFINSGGRIDSCESIPPLPSGLVLAASFNAEENIDACLLSGTPTVTAENMQYSIQATNTAGTGIIGTSLEINDPVIPPLLGLIRPKSFTVGQDITTFDFQNTGGEIDTCVSTPTLPAGLTISKIFVGEGGDTDCRLAGIPSEAAVEQSYTISASNVGGTSTSVISIVVVEVILDPPVFSAVDEFIFDVDKDIATIDLSDGESVITACTVTPTLPIGLVLSASCVLSGTPSAESPAQAYSFTANNEGLETKASIEITVTDLLDVPELSDLPDQIYVPSEFDITPLIFANTGGGELLETGGCAVSPTLPDGLELSRTDLFDSCVITGTPFSQENFVDYAVTARNASGSSTASIRLAVIQSPRLPFAEPQFLTVGQIMDPLVLGSTDDDVNLLTECSETTPLPAGLVFSLSADQMQCVLSGTPTEQTDGTTYRFNVSNIADTNNASLFIAVDLPVADSFEIPFDSATGLDISMSVSVGDVTIAWGDGSGDEEIISNGLVERDFVEPTTGLATITISNGFASVTDFRVANNSGSGFVFEASVFENFINLESFSINQGTLNGNLSSFSGLNKLETFFAALFTSGTDAVFEGDLIDIPTAVTSFLINVPGSTISGDLSDLKTEGITSFRILSDFLITGLVSDITKFDVLQRFELNGDLTLSGAISELPESLLSFYVGLDLNSALTGDLSDIPEMTTEFIVSGENTITGDIATLGENLTRLVLVSGNGSIVGDIQSIKPNLEALIVEKSNSLSGNIATIPDTLTTLILTGGENTLSGNIEDLHEDFTEFLVWGENTIGGDLGQLKVASPDINVAGLNTIEFVDATATWQPDGRVSIRLTGDSTGGMSINQTDDFLNYVSNTIAGSNTGSVISLQRITDQGRSSDSDAAVSNLNTLGFTIFVRNGVAEG